MNTQVETAPVRPERRIRIVSAAAAALTLLCMLSVGKSLVSFLPDILGDFAPFKVFSVFTNQLIWFAFMTAFLVLFVRIAASGRPFTKPNILILKIAGVILILNLILPPLCSVAVSEAIEGSGNLFQKILISLLGNLNIYNISEILIVMLCREIVYYGTMLQTESDETL